MRRMITLFVTAAVAGAGPVQASAAADGGAASAAVTARGAAASCAVTWGSPPKSAPFVSNRPLVDVRTGRHACFDRMVLDIRSDAPATAAGYHVCYVSRFQQDGSGRPLPMSGGAVLEIVVGAPSYDPETFEPTYAGRPGRPLPGVDLDGYRTFRDARYGASYEGTTQLGLGVRARLPFRVFPLGGRVVVDVAHSWSAAR
ncbi:hypothetical protein [Streptomyces sp. RKND-216]|uniref:AMIN-like domain-containing (lipo)protein n=1 Tax=Streptomyces sp. RKND-216 TaxID=2562581 RepID=UPI001FF9FEC9|nr:hypothetical protein [Streptomyces sp. RKND-216]